MGAALEPVARSRLAFGLSNRVFDSYDDIVAHCCEVWNKVADQPWRIISLGLRNWAHEF